MSRKNSREEKKKRRLLKALRQTPEAHVDLIHYVKQRTRCTTRTAEAVLLSGALQVDGKPVGFGWAKGNAGDLVKRLERFVPADVAARIQVTKLEEAVSNDQS